MASTQYVVVLFLMTLSFTFTSTSSSPHSILQITQKPLNSFFTSYPLSLHRKFPKHDNNKNNLYCDSWRLAVEAHNAPPWTRVPSRCIDFVKNYMTTGHKYRSDSDVVADYALEYARSVNISGFHDAWVFDVDETLLSNVPYYHIHGFGLEIFDENCFNEWVDLAEAPALPASLTLYKELELMGFKLFLLTGRDENQRIATEKNLLYVGYSNWERLILRGPSDKGKPATVYKSEKRMELEDEGYTIHGNSGDQWSDLLGFAVAKRSLKLPNPMYYIA